VLQADGTVLYHAVVSSAEVASAVSQLVAQYGVGRIAVGDRTAAKQICRAISSAALSLRPIMVDEHRSSEQGRRRYFRDNPPRGWRRLIPVTLQTPARPWDDYVAIVLAERYLAGLGGK
jgi:hypothetical protein